MFFCHLVEGKLAASILAHMYGVYAVYRNVCIEYQKSVSDWLLR